MSARRLLELRLDGDKYAVRCEPPDVPRGVLRYGEPWRDVLGDNLVGRLVSETASSRDVLAALESFLKTGGEEARARLEHEARRHREWGFEDAPATWRCACARCEKYEGCPVAVTGASDLCVNCSTGARHAGHDGSARVEAALRKVPGVVSAFASVLGVELSVSVTGGDEEAVEAAIHAAASPIGLKLRELTHQART